MRIILRLIIEEWLATIPDGKLPTIQKTEGKEEEFSYHLRVT